MDYITAQKAADQGGVPAIKFSKDKMVEKGIYKGNRDFYKSIIESAPTGYAYHKIILDKGNSPCDYEFIEVNIAFENLTGLKRSDVLGKNISEVLPDIKKSAFNWIKFYGNTAINGGGEEFEQFCEPLNRWYRVYVYSPKKQYFITLFTDITKGKLVYSGARDITEKVNASREISFQASLLKHVHNGIIVVDLNNTIIYWNKFAEELYQWKSDEVIGKNIINLLSPEEMKETVYENFKVLNRDGHWEGEFNVKKKDGSLIPVHITNTYSKDLESNNIGFIGISRDITAYKQAEASLNQSEESKRVLLDNIQTQVWYLTNEYTYGAVNRAHAAFNGVHINDFAFKNMYDIFPADIVDVCRQSNTEVFTTGKTVHTKEWLPHVSGEKRLVLITKTPKFGTNGSVEYVVCSGDDITEQEIANQRIRSSEAHLNALVSNTPAIIYSYTIDINGIPNLTYINNNVTNVLGFKPEDFVGNIALWASCVHPEDMLKLHEKLTGEEMMNEYRFKDKNGKYHWIHDQQKVYKRVNGITEIIGTWWDITERKIMEGLLFSEKEQLKTTLLSVCDGIISTDVKGKVLILNPIAKQLTGWTQEEAGTDQRDGSCDDLTRGTVLATDQRDGLPVFCVGKL